MKPKPIHGFKRVRNATRYSCQGLKAAFQNEAAFQEELLLASLMIPAAVYFADGYIDRVLLIGSVVLVLITELINSAIEAVVDRVGSEYHSLSKRAKDIGSASVMMTMLLTAYIWIEVLFLS